MYYQDPYPNFYHNTDFVVTFSQSYMNIGLLDLDMDM